MNTLREWTSRLRDALRPRRNDAELEQELRLHLEMAAEDERRRAGAAASAPASGLGRDNGGRAAVIRHGTIAQSLEALRDQRGLPWLDDLSRDLRYGFRVLHRNPLFASVAVITLALGIGANTAIFSLADAVLLRSLPVSNPRELVALRQRGPVGDSFPFTSAAATNLAAGREALSGLAAFRPVPGTHVSVDGETELTLIQFVSGDYFSVLGVHAILGRTLGEQDRDRVAVISHRYWQRRFGSDPNVAGRLLDVQGRAFTIVGVTPPEFFGTQPGRYIDVTAPLGPQTMQMPANARWLYLIGRLAPGVSQEQALAALRVRWARLEGAPRQGRQDSTLELDSGAQGLNELRREFSLPLRILMVTAGIVLLVACANLAGLSIVRGNARQREVAVRRSLGASRGRIVRQLLTESSLLAAAGGSAGVLLAYWTTGLLLAAMSRGRTPITLDVSTNAHTLAFAATVTIVTAILFGLLPAIGVSRTAAGGRLKVSASDQDGTRNAWGRAMVAAQIALLVILLTSAGLFVGSLRKLRSVDAGFRQDHVLVVSVSTGANNRGASTRALYEDLQVRFSSLPGVQSVSRSLDIPLGGEPSMSSTGIAVVGRPADAEDAPRVFHNLVGPRFFETMGTRLVAGRDFESGDDGRAPKVVVISESVVRRYFNGEEPLGRQIEVLGSAATIVGVVKDVRFTSLRTEAPLVTYSSFQQQAIGSADTFLVRASSLAPEVIMPLLKAEVRAAAPALPPPSVVTLDDRVAAGLVQERMLAALSTALGALAVILAAIGIYSTVAAKVARRQREIGIRMALGALPVQIARMVVSETFAIVAGGLAIGVPAAFAAGLAARSILGGVLFELSPTNPLVVISSAAAILAIASLSAYVPVRRASRTDPVAAIKYE